MRGFFFSLEILIPLSSQVRYVSSPFSGIFSTYIGAHLSKRQFCLRPLPRGLFFNTEKCMVNLRLWIGKFSSPLSGTFFQLLQVVREGLRHTVVFVPSLGAFFSINHHVYCTSKYRIVFVPFLGDFFSIACLRSPSPSALASAFAAGMGESLHQVLSFGDEMPISPVRASIGGDGNEKWCCLIPSTHPCFQT